MNVNIKKFTYLIAMLIAFSGSALFFTHLPFTHENSIAFHLNTFAVTWRLVANVSIVVVLLYLLWISGRNFLVGIDAKHSTVISKR